MMPMPKPASSEDQKTFIARFMSDKVMVREYPDQKQRAAVAHSTWRDSKKKPVRKGIAQILANVQQLLKRQRERYKVRWLKKDEMPPEKGNGFMLHCDLCKVEDAEDSTFVWGPVLVPEKVDKQGDVISKEEIEDAAHDFLEDGGRPGLLHKVMLGNRDVAVVESGLLRRPYTVAKGDILPIGTWMIGMRVYNERIRKLVISGELTGYSIGGQGVGIEE